MVLDIENARRFDEEPEALAIGSDDDILLVKLADGTGVKKIKASALKAYFAADVGDLEELDTEDKDSIVEAINENVGRLDTLDEEVAHALAFDIHNRPRAIPKDISSYVTDGTLYKRLNGTDGFDLFEDLYVGDYIHMSRAISAYEQTQTYQATGSDYVTIAGIDWYMHNGDNAEITYHHLVMVPGKGFEGTQHFGRSRMNPTSTTVGGYVASEMHTTTLGAVATAGSTAANATINQQLFAEFGSHLKTTRELLSNAIVADAANRLGAKSGAASGFAWADCQAVLMSEIEVLGSVAFSSSGFDVGNACRQLPLFRYSKTAQNNRSAYYWHKDIASAAYFCLCGSIGHANSAGASNARYYVCPRFVIAA